MYIITCAVLLFLLLCSIAMGILALVLIVKHTYTLDRHDERLKFNESELSDQYRDNHRDHRKIEERLDKLEGRTQNK